MECCFYTGKKGQWVNTQEALSWLSNSPAIILRYFTKVSTALSPGLTVQVDESACIEGHDGVHQTDGQWVGTSIVFCSCHLVRCQTSYNQDNRPSLLYPHATTTVPDPVTTWIKILIQTPHNVHVNIVTYASLVSSVTYKMIYTR
jgi:hypothetical protein